MIRRLLLIPLLLAVLAFPVQAQNQDNLPVPHDQVMLAGSDYVLNLTRTDAAGVPINITGYRYAGQFRAAAAPAGALFADYSTAIVDPAAGKLKVVMPRARTKALSGRFGIWDLLEIDTSNLATFLSGGKASVKPTVTVTP